MAGNLVKWWKHKILGGYKQFSVQECTTDSEELMYHQVRASSSCSAPPDLLLVSDRENNIPLRSPVVNIIGATTAPATTTTSPSSGINACHITSATNNNQRHNQKLLHQQQQQQQQLLLMQQQQQQQQQHHHVTTQQLSLAYNGAKDIGGNGKHQKQSGIGGSSHSKHGQQQQQQQECQQQQQLQQTTAAHDIEGQMEAHLNSQSSARHAHHAQYQQQHHHHQQQQQQQQQQQRAEEHIRLEEFTCDVSVEGGKSSQPLQFSFTFYDLDGHHGKITKDDIVGIVYTIYESIGKSVVVPHSGSKTINVRLTVSPEGKSKTAKNKKTPPGAMVLDSIQRAAPLASASQANRRLHRYRPRKLIKSDEEDDDSNSDRDRENTHVNGSNLSQVLAHKSASKSHKLLNKLKTEQQCCNQQQSVPPNATEIPNSPLETIYDNVKTVAAATTPDACRECQAAVDESRNAAAISPTAQYPANKTPTTNEAYMKHVASTRIKMLRKSRKQKHQDCLETRQRSLSVGNETCYKNRHLQKPPTQHQLPWHADQQLNHSGVDVVDGVQLRNPLKVINKTAAGAQKRNSAECWKTALNRNDLISIIRESMEKNRLCFQLNGKPQANVSPIRHSQPPLQQAQHHPQHLVQHQQNTSNKHSQQLQTSTATATTVSQQRQRSNTVSKIPTLIANHSNSHSASPHQSHYSSARQRSSSCVNTISNNNNNNNNDATLHEHHNSTNSSNNMYNHLQPHIPIYHQQLAINPAVIAAHNGFLNAASGSSSAAGHHGKMNLCGYDSFLHATICGGGLSHSPSPHSSLANQATSPPAVSSSQQHQQIATVQPIMSTNTQNTSKQHLSLAVTPNQIKTSKILRSGSYAQTHHQHQHQHHSSQVVQSNATQNSPQYHGYQRLPSSSKHNLAALHLVSPTIEKPPLEQLDKWRRDQVKNYDQLLYAKLSEKLQQTNLVSSTATATATGRENNQRRKHRVLKHRRANALIAEANNVTLNSKLCIRDDSDYATTLHIDGDSVECENLLAQTSDEESHSQHETPAQMPEELVNNSTTATRHVAEGTLVDLDDDADDGDTQMTQRKCSLNGGDTLLSADSEVNDDLHLIDDALEIEEDLAQVLHADLEEVMVATETGRNSANSNEINNTDAATVANTAAANTSTTSSSLIHRYVHEHIHHHYHHFEGKEE